MKKNIFKAFTLAEIMIVLTIIGVITAILLPVAINSSPDENVMKFKKGNNTLGTVIRELVNSDQYYANGDLGIKPDGTLIDGTHDGDYKYFCETFADMLNVKESNCDKLTDVYPSAKTSYRLLSYDVSRKEEWDKDCITYIDGGKIKEIVVSDGIIFYQVWPHSPFGIHQESPWAGGICSSTTVSGHCQSSDYRSFKIKYDGFFDSYTLICMDVDGVDKGEDPFGYALRVDGKILPGPRASEWINKSMQKGD